MKFLILDCEKLEQLFCGNLDGVYSGEVTGVWDLEEFGLLVGQSHQWINKGIVGSICATTLGYV